MFLDVTRLVTLLAACHVTAAGGPQPPGACGTPGVPSNGSVISATPGPGPGPGPGGEGEGGAPRYAVGARVKYVCAGRHRVRGGEWRTCGPGGRWGGEPPYCALDLAAGRPAQQSGTLLSYAPALATDGTPDTCSFTPQAPAPRWWQVSLGDSHNVTRVSVTISKGSLQHFTVYVIELLEDNKALYEPCASYQGVFPSATLELPCSGAGQRGSFVYVRDDRAEEEYLGLCEVQVFGAGDSACGLPDIPRHAKLKVENRTASFSCEEGYRLRGGHSLTCNHRGRWTGVAGRCEEIQCPVPPAPEHGGVNILPPASPPSHTLPLSSLGAPRVGWRAEYRCDPGHGPPEPPSRLCGPSGEWSGDAPVCARLHCGPPPSVTHSHSSLINSSGIELAVYTCRHGTAVEGALVTAVSTCESSGVWKPPNITCQPQQNTTDTLVQRNILLKPVDRRSSARALRPAFSNEAEVFLKSSDVENEPIQNIVIPASDSIDTLSGSREMQLVTALAVVATLLLASVFVLFMVLAVYKKKRFSRNQEMSSSQHNSQDSPKQMWSPGTDRNNFVAMSYANKAFSNSTNSMNRQLPTPNNSSRNSLQITHSMNSGTKTLHFSKKRLSDEFVRKVKGRTELQSESYSNGIQEPAYETINKTDSNSLVNNADMYLDEDEYLNQQLYHVICESENAYGTSSHRSENGYELVPENVRVKREPSYQSVSEFARNKTEHGYESSSEKGDNGYEKIKEKDHQYEALRERKDHGYEIVKEINEPDITPDDSKSNSELSMEPEPSRSGISDAHVKSVPENQHLNEQSDTVPDILKGIGSDRELENDDVIEVPAEILAMYAKIDRSKKKRKLKATSGELQLIIKHIGEEDNLDGYEKLPVLLMKSKDLDEKPTPPPRPKNMMVFGTPIDSVKEVIVDPELSSDNDNCSSVGSFRTAPSSNFSTISTRSGEYLDLSSSRPLPPIPRN